MSLGCVYSIHSILYSVGAIAGGTASGVVLVVILVIGGVGGVITILIKKKEERKKKEKRKQKDQIQQTNPCSVRMNADANIDTFI